MEESITWCVVDGKEHPIPLGAQVKFVKGSEEVVVQFIDDGILVEKVTHEENQD